MDKTLLVVDDEKSILRSLSRQLTLEGYRVHSASSGAEGLSLLEDYEFPVVISDQCMPGMNGAEFLSHVKERNPQSIRMILSGYADFNAVADAINNGAIYKFLTKPWDAQSLLKHVENAFALHEKLLQQSHAGKIIGNAIEAVVVTDREDVILSTNTSFSLMTEFNEQEVIGKQLQLIDFEKVDKFFIEEINFALKEDGIWQGELWFRKKLGLSYPVFLSISTIQDPKGDIQQRIYSFIDITEERLQADQLCYQNRHDLLTGLLNRDALSERLTSILLNAEFEHYTVAVIMIDIDRFDQINNVLGHRVGDLTLKAVADRLKKWAKSGEAIARLGNDEFAVILNEPIDSIKLDEYLIKLQNYLSEALTVESNDLHIMSSIGVSVYPTDGHEASELMKNANTALATAKNLGVNHYQLFNQSLKTDTKRILILENDIIKGMKDKQFILHFQPKVSIKENRVVGVEGLMRWDHPEYGLIMPHEFLSLSEEIGLLVDIEREMLFYGCSLLSKWQHQFGLTVTMSLNLSAKEFSRPDLIEFIKDVLKQTGVSPEALEIEVTESVLLDDIKQCEVCLHALHELGIKLTLDDFGTGYSSLKYLTHLPFDIVKIDKSFTRNILINKRAELIVAAILQLCQYLSLTTVVEGVENVEQMNFLKHQSCDIAQGYLISQAMAEEDVVSFINSYGALDGGTN